MKIKPYDKLTFSDDFMFCKIMENEEICKKVIEQLLDIKVGKVQKHVIQNTFSPTPESHGIRLDVYVKDLDKVFDIEMQTTQFPAIEKRIRYYQSVIDIDNFEHNQDYSELPESYIVFLCLDDPLGRALPVYTIKNIIEESPSTIYNESTHKVLFNASAYEKVQNKHLKAFLKYIYTQETDSELTKEIQSQVLKSKGHQSWRAEYMTLEMKIHEEKKLSLAEGRALQKAEDAVIIAEQAASLAEKDASLERMNKEIEKLRTQIFELMGKSRIE